MLTMEILLQLSVYTVTGYLTSLYNWDLAAVLKTLPIDTLQNCAIIFKSIGRARDQ